MAEIRRPNSMNSLSKLGKRLILSPTKRRRRRDDENNNNQLPLPAKTIESSEFPNSNNTTSDNNDTEDDILTNSEMRAIHRLSRDISGGSDDDDDDDESHVFSEESEGSGHYEEQSALPQTKTEIQHEEVAQMMIPPFHSRVSATAKVSTNATASKVHNTFAEERIVDKRVAEHNVSEEEEKKEKDAIPPSRAGVQSSYIQSLIELQKGRGNWCNSIAHKEENTASNNAPNAIGQQGTSKQRGVANNNIQPPIANQSHYIQKQQQQQQQQPSTSAPKDEISIASTLNKAISIKRTLSEKGLVTMLKIQPICEKNEMHDDMHGMNLEETILQRGSSLGSRSTMSFDNNIAIDAANSVNATATAANAIANANASGKETLGAASKSSPPINEKLQKEDNLDNSNGIGPRRSSFLPPHFSEDNDENYMNVVNTPLMMEGSPGSDDVEEDNDNNNLAPTKRRYKQSSVDSVASSEFFLGSIASENMTHASSAPDYDYNSMSSEDDDEVKNKNRRVKNPKDIHMDENNGKKENVVGDAVAEKNLDGDGDAPGGYSSSEDSIDLAFGQTKKETNDNKWEEIRLDRQRRRSSASGTTQQTRVSRNDSAFTSVATSVVPPMSKPNLSRARSSTQYQRQYSDQSEEESDVDTDNDSFSVISGMKSRFNQFYNSNFVRGKSSRNGLDSSTRSSGAESQQSEKSEYSASSDEGTVGTVGEEMGGPNQNILSEGEFYVAMSMLVYIYALLRETSLLGHTDIDFDEVDVNSFQSEPGYGGSTTFLSKTKSAGFIIRVVMDELEKKGAFSSVEKSDMYVLKEFKQWVTDSRSKQLDAATEQTIKDLRRKIARRRWKKAINAVRLMVRLGQSESNCFDVQLARRQNIEEKKRLTSSPALGLEGPKAPRMNRALAGSMIWMHNQRHTIMNSLGISSRTESQESLPHRTLKRNSLVGVNEIKEIINDALEEPRFFIEGSLLSNLIESGIEVVWFGDRHPNDVVYCICVNRQFKRVSVVFRGTVTSHNWWMNLKLQLSEHPNPIKENYPGKAKTLGLHTGFSLYMTRQRKDDSLTKIEEIFENIDTIGREVAPDGDYELSITGHSLGGALATILSFYAATSNVFSKVKTIRVFTYAAPRVGCQRFLHAYNHLEKIGKLRHARFTITRDFVPLVPFHGFTRSYKHIGMHIRLLGVDKAAQYWLRRALDVTYPKHHDVVSQLVRISQVNILRNLNTPQGYKNNHSLSEYQRRIRFTINYRSMLVKSEGSFALDKKRARLKTLDEYYFIKGASNASRTGELTRIALEDRAKESVRRESRKLVTLLSLTCIILLLMLMFVLHHSVYCEHYPIILYPLSIFTSCRKGECGACTTTHTVAELPPVQLKSTRDTGNARPDSYSNDKSEEMPELSLIINAIIKPSNSEVVGSWVVASSAWVWQLGSTCFEAASFLASWLSVWKWKAHNSHEVAVPSCVWGSRCDHNNDHNPNSHSHLPVGLWGVGVKQQGVPGIN